MQWWRKYVYDETAGEWQPFRWLSDWLIRRGVERDQAWRVRRLVVFWWWKTGAWGIKTPLFSFEHDGEDLI